MEIIAKYLLVDAEPRYWEDAKVNNEIDEDGSLIPCREKEKWQPLIDILKGQIINWEQGKIAKIHYKVCDQGEYFLLDENKDKIAKYYSFYVPDILSPKRDGYGDYIILDVNQDGFIDGFKSNIVAEQWQSKIDRKNC